MSNAMIFSEFHLISEVIFKNIVDPDDTSVDKEISRYEWVNS